MLLLRSKYRFTSNEMPVNLLHLAIAMPYECRHLFLGFHTCLFPHNYSCDPAGRRERRTQSGCSTGLVVRRLGYGIHGRAAGASLRPCTSGRKKIRFTHFREIR
jgi:hypothetical protein